MDDLVAILFLIAIAVLVLPVAAIVVAVKASGRGREAERKLAVLDARCQNLERQVQRLADVPGAGGQAGDEVKQEPGVGIPARRSAVTPPAGGHPAPVVVPGATGATPEPAASDPVPPALPAIPPGSSGVPAAAKSGGVPREPKRSPISIEQFMGVKLFAWLGGVAMFFGVIFFVKYAFDNNLIPPAVRVALGFVAGLGLLVGGLWTHRRDAYRVLGQALCATGVVVLYGVTFAAHAVYHFEFFSPPVTFGLMALVTVVAFLLAVRLDALVVAVLGMVGGFLSPVLLPAVGDHPFALFSYVAVLDVGILALSRRNKWGFLSVAAAVGTVLLEARWFATFFVAGRYFEGSATLVPMGLLLFFSALFVAAAWWTKRKGGDVDLQAFAALGVISVSTVVAFWFFEFPDIVGRPFLFYGFIFAQNIAVMGLAPLSPRLAAAPIATAMVTFVHLAIWTVGSLARSPELLASALAVYLVFGALHACYPLLRQRFLPGGDPVPFDRLSGWSSAVVLLLMLFTLFSLPHASFAIWVGVFLADLLVIGLAFAGGAVAPIIGSLVLTLVVATAWFQRLPKTLDSLAPLLLVIVLFGALFAVAGVFLGRRRLVGADSTVSKFLHGMTPVQALPVLSGTLPFGLLVMAVTVLPVGNPSPVFGVVLLLVILLLGLAVIGRQSLLVPVALLCTLAVEVTWHAARFRPDSAWVPLVWYIGFYALFTLFPFVFRRAFSDQIAPWVASALSGVGHFFLVHDLVRRAFSDTLGGAMGLVPVAFAIPAVFALIVVLRIGREMESTQQSQLAWFGGVALLFITLVFPIQFDRQWLTVGWALEGAAVLWLFHRVPHQGLKFTGIGLLTVAFVRLALNPAVFEAYGRSGTPVFNWHLYTFGLVAAALGVGGWLLRAGDRMIKGVNVRAVLFGFCGVLLFILLNLEIADFFTPPGNRIVTFEFGGNFARDMTYSIAWGIFALGVLGLGIRFGAAPARYAAIGLLVITLLKVFIYDLSSIESVYRIGALIGVSIIAFVASFLYQQYFNRSKPA